MMESSLLLSLGPRLSLISQACSMKSILQVIKAWELQAIKAWEITGNEAIDLLLRSNTKIQVVFFPGFH